MSPFGLDERGRGTLIACVHQVYISTEEDVRTEEGISCMLLGGVLQIRRCCSALMPMTHGPYDPYADSILAYIAS
jgi:hypothetical protein